MHILLNFTLHRLSDNPLLKPIGQSSIKRIANHFFIQRLCHACDVQHLKYLVAIFKLFTHLKMTLNVTNNTELLEMLLPTPFLRNT